MKKEQSYLVEVPNTLLAFMLQTIKGQSRNTIKHLLSRGQVLIDGTVQRQFDLPLQPGQTVTVLNQAKGAALPFPILYEDERLIAVDKPAGLLSVGTERERNRTAYRMVADYLRARDGLPRIFILHRLDRDTSGVLVFAKEEAFRDFLQENWSTIATIREYYAVVEGTDIPQSGVCRSMLQENKGHKVYSVQSRDGKEAISRYRVLDRQKGYSLLSVQIETGRKNQIRVHLSELGYPVAGDKKYGATSDPMRRLALHANRLVFSDLHVGKELSFIATVPKEFSRMFPRFSF